MIKKFSKYLSDYFVKIGIVERKNKSWCQYVIEKKAIQLIFGMATLIFSLYIKKTLEIALFLIIFCSIRRHIGGWHASSPWKCLTLSSVMLLLITVFLEPSVERLPPIFTLILNAVLFADILRCSPLYPQCVHFGENEKNANNQKKKVVIYTILFFNIIFCESPHLSRHDSAAPAASWTACPAKRACRTAAAETASRAAGCGQTVLWSRWQS